MAKKMRDPIIANNIFHQSVSLSVIGSLVEDLSGKTDSIDWKN